MNITPLNRRSELRNDNRLLRQTHAAEKCNDRQEI